MIHQLKVKKQFFGKLVEKKKKFEIRKNDRNFSVGDFVGLNEVDENGVETGTWMLQRIVYIMNDEEYCKEGYVVLGLEDYLITSGRDKERVTCYKGGEK